MNKRNVTLSAIFLFSLFCGVVSPAKCEDFITATGTGYPPSGISDKGQATLLAKRAAKLDGYRNLLDTYKKISPYVVRGTGIAQTSGFLRGAREIDTRYYDNGKVEVVLGLEVTLNTNETEKINASGCTIVPGKNMKGLPGKQITRTEWMELIKPGGNK